MLFMNDIKIGTLFKYDNAPYVVLKADHVQMGRGSAVLRTKIKNVITGQVLDLSLKNGDKFDEAQLDRAKATYLYADEAGLNLMDTQSYEQFTLPVEAAGDAKQFLCENMDVEVMSFDGKPVTVQLPKVVELEVVETAPGVRGDTAQGSVSKPAVLVSGATVNVPLFVKQGDKIRVNTERGEYLDRA
jgi:elongation factor P